MLTTRDIRRRIRSISSTSQITKAMQMVAASKMRRAQQATLSTRPFAQLLYRIQRRAATHAGEFTHPLMEVREVRRRAVVLVGPDKGLCGGLNTNLFRVAAQFDPATTVFITVGRKPAQFIARSGRTLAAEFTIADTPRFADARSIATFARELFLMREVDQVLVTATRYINTLNQQAGTIELLPIGEIRGMKIPGAESEAAVAAEIAEYTFEPSPEAVLSYLFVGYTSIFMFRVLLEAKASEQSARMVAMKNATDNAESLIKDLTLEYNKLRQGNITRELLDIAGGQAAQG